MAQSVLGMIKRHFRVIDKEDFLVIYKVCQTSHRILCSLVAPLIEGYSMLRSRSEAGHKMVQGMKKLSYECRLKQLHTHSLEQRRIRWDLMETSKILKGKERIIAETFFRLADNSKRLHGT